MARCIHCGEKLKKGDMRMSILTSQSVKCPKCGKNNEISWFTVILTSILVIAFVAFGIKTLTSLHWSNLEIVIYMIGSILAVCVLCPYWYRVEKRKIKDKK